jgi:peptide/nickel transport system permease protein
MLRFVGGQLLRFVLLMVAVSMVAFLLVSLSPIDPVQANVGQVAYLNMSEAKRAQLVEYWGTGTPVWERYAHWAASALQGDLGMSLRYNAPVTQVIAQRFVNSAALMAAAWLLSGVLGLLLGIAAAVRHDSWLDRAIKAYSILLASTPTFWLALLFLIVFSVWLGVFPLGFSVPIGVAPGDVTLAQSLHHLVLPALTLSVAGIANIALHTREKAIDVLQSDYVRFARTRGMRTAALIWRHGLRNLALPALTLQFASINEIFGGSVLVEQVFSYPGLGQAAVTAGLGGDAALLVGIALISAALVFSGNLAANLLYSVIDPRMRPGAPRTRLSTQQQSKGRRAGASHV